MDQTAAESHANKLGRSLKDLIHNEVITDAQGNTIKVFRHEGFIFPPFGDLAISKIKTLELRDDDVFLLGYPKTGCHWTFEMLSMILHRRAKVEGMGKTVGFIEMASPGVVGSLPSPRILNSHILFDMLPQQVLPKKTKIVLTVRNAKDTLVSFYNHVKNLFPMYGYDGKFEDYFPLFLEGRVDYGSYFDYHRSWDKAIRENPDHPIIVMCYEDMKEDLPREVRRLAKFLEVDLDEDLVAAIAKAGGFDSMVKAGTISHALRKGQVGDWQNWFTVAQDEVMDDVIKDKMADVSFFKPRYTLP